MNRVLHLSAAVACTLMVSGVAAAPGAVTDARFGNGMRVIFLEDHGLPTISLSLMFKGAGATADPPGKTGTAALTASLLREGTRTLPSQKLSETVDRMGASLSAYADHDRAVASASGLSRNLPRLMELLADMVRNPALTAEEFERLKARTLANLQRGLDDADGMVGRTLDRVILGDHPYGLPASGVEPTVKAITLADVQAFHAAHYRADNAVLVVAGDMQPASVAPLMEKFFGTFAPGTAETPAPAPTPAPRKARVVLVDKPDLTQVKLAFGHLGIPREHPDYYAAAVMNGVLGGSGFMSRLMKVVRSDLGLTYGIRSGLDARKVGGLITVTSFTRTDQAFLALAAAQNEIRKLQEEGIKPQEVEDVKNYMIGAYALSIETPEAQASILLSSDLYNLGLDHLRSVPAKIRAVTAADVSRVAQGLINRDAFRFVVVGPAQSLKEGAAAMGLGDVEVRPHTRWFEQP